MPKLPKLQSFRPSLPSQSYRPLKSAEKDQPLDDVSWPTERQQASIKQSRIALITMVVVGFFALLGVVALTRASYLEQRAASSSASLNSATASATVPQYFQTSPEIYAGKITLSSRLQLGVR